MHSYICHRFITMLATDKSPELVRMYPSILTAHEDLRAFEAIDPKKIIIFPNDLYPDLYEGEVRLQVNQLDYVLLGSHYFDDARRTEAPYALSVAHKLIISIIRDLVPFLIPDDARDGWSAFAEKNLIEGTYNLETSLVEDLGLLLSSTGLRPIYRILVKALDMYKSYLELYDYISRDGGVSTYGSIDEYIKERIHYHENALYEVAASHAGLAVSYMIRQVPYDRTTDFRSALDSVVYSVALAINFNESGLLRQFLDSSGMAIDISRTGAPGLQGQISDILKKCSLDLDSMMGGGPSDSPSEAVEKAIHAATKNDKVELVLARIAQAVSDCVELNAE